MRGKDATRLDSRSILYEFTFFHTIAVSLGGGSLFNSYAHTPYAISHYNNLSASAQRDMSKWSAKEQKTPNEDALREDDLQYGTGGMTEEELAEK